MAHVSMQSELFLGGRNLHYKDLYVYRSIGSKGESHGAASHSTPPSNRQAPLPHARARHDVPNGQTSKSREAMRRRDDMIKIKDITWYSGFSKPSILDSTCPVQVQVPPFRMSLEVNSYFLRIPQTGLAHKGGASLQRPAASLRPISRPDSPDGDGWRESGSPAFIQSTKNSQISGRPT